MQQRHTTRKFRLDRRRARYRELNFPGRPQIAWLGPSCGFHVAYRKETTCQRNNENGGTVISKHLRLSCPYATTSQMASAAKKQPLLVLAGSLKLENEQSIWDFQRLQAHGAVSHHRRSRSKTICQTQRAVTADRI